MTTADWAELIAFLVIFVTGMLFILAFALATPMPGSRQEMKARNKRKRKAKIAQAQSAQMVVRPVQGPFPRDMTLNEYWALAHGCLFCSTDDMVLGPEGGLCVNILCAGCGGRYNVSNISPPFACQITEGPSEAGKERAQRYPF